MQSLIDIHSTQSFLFKAVVVIAGNFVVIIISLFAVCSMFTSLSELITVVLIHSLVPGTPAPEICVR